MPRHLNPGGQQFRGDRGAADPRVAQALAAYQAGQGSEQAALAALSGARLLVPVVAVLSGSHAPGQGDSGSEIVMPTLIGRDGRPAVLAFTALDALARWRPQARPVPAEADRVWRAAAADGCAVVIDVAGPVPLAVEGARLEALAAGRPVPPPHEDPDVHHEVRAALAGEPLIAGFSLAAGSEGTDLAIILHLASGHAPPAEGRAAEGRAAVSRAAEGRAAETRAAVSRAAVSRAANGLAAALAARLRRGIEVRIRPNP